MKNTGHRTELKYCDISEDEYFLCLHDVKICRTDGRNPVFHFHNALEIGVCRSGRGKMFLGDSTIPYKDREIFIVPMDLPHNTSADEGIVCFWDYIFIDAGKLVDDFYRGGGASADQLKYWIHRRGRKIGDGDQPEISRLVWQILQEMQDKKLLYREVVLGSLLELVMQIARINAGPGEKREAAGRVPLEQIQPALAFLNENYSRPLRIGEIAAVCHMSESHFRRIFEKYTGVTPVEYLNRMRIRRACTLLYRTKDSVEEISHKVGFSSVSTFNRNFRRQLGTSPYRWRKEAEERRWKNDFSADGEKDISRILITEQK